jgi:putative peptidoglycan lipid II flippase
LQKVFSSMRHMLAFALVNVAASVVQVIFTAALTPQIGMAAVGLGSAVFYLLIDALALALLKRDLSDIGLRSVGASMLWGLALGAVGAAVGAGLLRLLGWGAVDSRFVDLAILLVSGSVSVAVTFSIAMALHLPQASFLTSLLNRLLRRR